MQFIQNKLADIGMVNYVEYVHNDVMEDFLIDESTEISDVSADSVTCHVSYHVSETNRRIKDRDASFYLRDVTDVVIKPKEQYDTELLASDVIPSVVTRVSPAITVLLVNAPHNNAEIALPFTDSGMADRVARAITHAARLCGN